tara:strand:+ start:1399 stop:1563 length:165 start_codon:yes stop_codon:yes gene_type:complete
LRNSKQQNEGRNGEKKNAKTSKFHGKKNDSSSVILEFLGFGRDVYQGGVYKLFD